jgi:hypothetical protein
MNTKRLIISIFALLLFGAGRVQSQPTLPTVIPPSPAVANFLRYGEIPIDYSTGVPNISVPLITLKSRKLELPISISYHASGIKVEDKASTIGLGWVLNGAGFVSESILGNGADDAASQPTYKTSGAFEHARDSANAIDSLRCMVSHIENFGSLIWGETTSKDWQSDRYSYQLPGGGSGTFRYDYLTKNLIKVPYSGARIQKILSGSAITGFIITDENGITYTFGIPSNWHSVAVSTRNWDLLSIVSADKTDTIRFTYKASGNVYLTQTCNSALDYGGFPFVNLDEILYSAAYNFSNSLSNSTTAERILDSIISSSTIVKFTDVNDRQDRAQSTDSFRITNMSVYSRLTGQQIKSFSFNQSYFGSSGLHNQRLRLDSLSIAGNNSTVVETYRFKYYTAVDLPEYPENTVPLVYPIDFWGYFNNTGNASLIQSTFIPDTIGPFTACCQAYPSSTMVGTLIPDSNYTKADMIQEIDYPTGGSTVFKFEPNQSSIAYYYNGLPLESPPNNNNMVGGLRIQNISNYTDAGILANSKTYAYSDGLTKMFSIDLFQYDYRVEGNASGLNYVTDRTTFYSTPFMPLKADNGPPVFYSSVTEYLGDALGDVGATEYDYVTPPAAYHSSDSNPPFDGPFFQDPYEMDMGDYIPQLASKIVYKNVNATYIPVKRIDNAYSAFVVDTFYTGMHNTLATYYPLGGSDMSTDYKWCSMDSTVVGTETLGYPYYIYPFDMHATQQVNVVTQTKDYDYSPDGTQNLVSTTNYTYGDLASYTYGKAAHTQPTEKDFIDSKGDTLKTIYKFPDNFTGTSPYDSMVSWNMLESPVEQDSYKNSYFLQSQKTNYFNWGNSLIAPQTVQTTTLNSAADTRLQFNAYDPKGNLTSVSKQNDEKITYLWNYNTVYPVAQVTNADTGSIAYTSFEGDDKGKWSFSGTPASSSAALTGTMIYTLSSNSITRAGLSSGATYIVSYWSSGSSYSVTGSTGTKQGKTITISGTSWTYYEHTVTGVTSVTVSGSGSIDELRLYPKDAQMKTYAYTPLIGVTAECDIDNRVTYYIYDNFGRLTVIKDQDGNIIKTINYHYAGQP